MQDFTITTSQGIGQMSYAGGDSLFNNVFLSLAVARGSLFVAPGFGLQRRPRVKNSDATARLIKGDIQSALQWLLDTKRAIRIEVTMERETLYDKNRLKAAITVTAPDNRVINYEKFVEVV